MGTHEGLETPPSSPPAAVATATVASNHTTPGRNAVVGVLHELVGKNLAAPKSLGLLRCLSEAELHLKGDVKRKTRLSESIRRVLQRSPDRRHYRRLVEALGDYSTDVGTVIPVLPLSYTELTDGQRRALGCVAAALEEDVDRDRELLDAVRDKLTSHSSSDNG